MADMTTLERKNIVLNMRVNADLLARIDYAARQLGISRSRFIREAVVKRAIETVNRASQKGDTR